MKIGPRVAPHRPRDLKRQGELNADHKGRGALWRRLRQVRVPWPCAHEIKESVEAQRHTRTTERKVIKMTCGADGKMIT
jgi:hypothetical protein